MSKVFTARSAWQKVEDIFSLIGGLITGTFWLGVILFFLASAIMLAFKLLAWIWS